jgi:hypothetical protein
LPPEDALTAHNVISHAVSIGGSRLLTGHLIFRSTFLPRALGVLLAPAPWLLIAGVDSGTWEAISTGSG